MSYGLSRRRRQADDNSASGESASYDERQAMTPIQRATFKGLGGRFRSQPGAPLAQPPQGLTTSGLSPMATPEVTAGRDAEWGSIFGRNSVFGGRNGAPITTAPKPMTTAAESGGGRFRGIAADDPDEVRRTAITELEDWHRSTGVSLPEMQPIAEADNYTTGRRTKSFQLGRYGTGSVSIPLPQRLAALNSEPDLF